MPTQQSKLQTRSHYGYFNPSLPLSPQQSARESSPAHRTARKAPPDSDTLVGAMRFLNEDGKRSGIAFRIAVSAFLEDVAALMQRADRVFRRLEDIYEKVIRTDTEGTRGEGGQPLPLDDIASMVDLVSTDFEADVPDSLIHNVTVNELLMQDGTWVEEAQLLSLGRRALVGFLQRRAEHLQARIGARLDVDPDPRKWEQTLRAMSRITRNHSPTTSSIATPRAKKTKTAALDPQAVQVHKSQRP
jgi:hypothetical protein